MDSKANPKRFPAGEARSRSGAVAASKTIARPSIGDTWRALIGRVSGKIGTSRLRGLGRNRLLDSMQTAELLLASSGEAERLRIASLLADLIRQADDAELLQFFLYLASNFGPEEPALKSAASAYLEQPDEASAATLYAVSEPRRQELLRRLNMAPQGTALIVLLRERALDMIRQHPEIGPVASDLQHLLSSWFNRGFLHAEQINWDSPASVLENVIRYEAVHEIHDWNSLRSRLQGNRRCFGFFHPAMPGIPLIFIEVALTMEMSGAIAPVLSLAEQEERLEAPTRAIFYSINNCQPGLKGINLGDLLIKQVVLDLRTEFPSLKYFATLSPIPGFRRWLTKAQAGSELIPASVSKILATDQWWLDPARSEQIHDDLLRLCARYLSGMGPDGQKSSVSDPVARFHLSNGARLERLNWLADLSAKRLDESFGMMVNYSYHLESIEANHRAFLNNGQVIMSNKVRQLCESDSAAQKFSLLSLVPIIARAVRSSRKK